VEGLIRIRPLTAADLDAVLEIQSSSPEASQWPRAEYERMIPSELAASPAAPGPREAPEAPGRTIFLWGGESAGKLVAFLVVRKVSEEVEILNLAVTPAAPRRVGVGSRLVRHGLAEAKRDGARRAYLEVRESNRAAVAFYERLGFSCAGRRKQYYRNPPEDAVLLSANLD